MKVAVWARCVVCGKLTKEKMDFDVWHRGITTYCPPVPICDVGPKNRAGDTPCKWEFICMHLIPVEDEGESSVEFASDDE